MSTISRLAKDIANNRKNRSILKRLMSNNDNDCRVLTIEYSDEEDGDSLHGSQHAAVISLLWYHSQSP